MALVAGCVDAAPDDTRPGATPTVTIDGRDLGDVLTRAPDAPEVPVAPDVCALASELPGDNICSLICDPDAMEAQLVAEGTPAGTCYEMRCALDGVTVTVGVCLPPSP
jgi:hypothetical protein